MPYMKFSFTFEKHKLSDMGSFLCLFVTIVCTFSIGFVSTDSTVTFLLQICQTEFNYTPNSLFETNLNRLLSNLSSGAFPVNFYNTTFGEIPDKVYLLTFCPSYIASQDCHSCIQSAAVLIAKKCPNQKGAVIYYLECVLRYANYSFFSIVDYELGIYWSSPQQVYNSDQFDRAFTDKIDELIPEAALGSSATGEVSVTNTQLLYTFVQCTPDLNRSDCESCLRRRLVVLQNYCYGDEWALSYVANCQIRYSLAPFYNANMAPSPPPSRPSTNSTVKAGAGKRRWVRIVVIATICLVASLVILVILIRIYSIRRKTKAARRAAENAEITPTIDSLKFHYGTIRDATNKFSDANKLGEGGFGPVYKGVLVNGQEIAVKKLSGSSKQGQQEFKNEVMLLARLRHKHLVTLLGFCFGGKEKLLVYEFMPNKSLDHFVFDPIKCIQLDWKRHYCIIQGIARGLLYLHEGSQDRVIHRDLKPSNILLDAAMEPKISDFGTARLVLSDDSHLTASKIMGTLGYMAPEYTKRGYYSVKSDVYSFGVILLEILSGQNIFSFHDKANGDNLLSYAWRNWKKNTALDIVDPTITCARKDDILRCIHIGLLCVQENAAERPTMDLVVNMLGDSSISLSLPSHPAFFTPKTMESVIPFRNRLGPEAALLDPSETISEQRSVNEVTITELDAR